MPPLKADPEVQARIHELRVYLRRYRAACRWLFWSPVSGVALLLFFPLPIALLPAIGAFAANKYYERPPLPLRIIPCFLCDKKRRYVKPFDDWVCGYCNKTHTYTSVPGAALALSGAIATLSSIHSSAPAAESPSCLMR